MKPVNEIDQALIQRIRSGDTLAWGDLIARYEGRLLAFTNKRLANRSASEDIVQEAFIGFLNSLPNYDGRRSLESYLFTICAHKLTDYLRREGRRPAIPMSAGSDSGTPWQFPGSDRPASSIARSDERKSIEADSISMILGELVEHWQQRGDWTRLKCIELLIVRGVANKQAAADLGISEQKVANYKFEFLDRMKKQIRSRGLPTDVFPELQNTSS